VQIVKNGEATLKEILIKVKNENADPKTMKQFVGMCLDSYQTKTFDLTYLKEELELLSEAYVE
jgi:hypothetical protein